MPQVLMIGSATVLIVAGIAHLVLTFAGPLLRPVEHALQARMAEVPLGISRRMTVWCAWIGFNASHSASLMLFGAVYGYLALSEPTLLFRSHALIVVGLVYLSGYLWLAKRYWFSGPMAVAGCGAGALRRGGPFGLEARGQSANYPSSR